jgi:2-keto-myo-inositol isomerase
VQRGIAGMALMQADLLTSVEVANTVGYEVVELRTQAIEDFLARGHRVEELAAKFRGASVRPHVIGAIVDVDIPAGPQRKRTLQFCRHMSAVAQAIGCRNIQVVSGSSFAGLPWPAICRETARGLREVADVAGEYGLTIAYEPLAWMPVRTVAQALTIISEAGRPNLGILVDTFHVFAGEDDLEAIRRLDPRIMPTVHLGDAAARQSSAWSDDDRYVMPGDGVVPLHQIMQAILDTGYDGVITDEVFPKPQGPLDARNIAQVLKAKGDAVLAAVSR